MAAAYRSSAGTFNSSSNSNVVSKPTGTTDGDFLLAIVYFNSATVTITPPSGWTLLETNNTPQTAKTSYYYKIASSEGASWTWNFDATSRNRASVHAFSGVDGTIPYLARNIQGNDSGSNAIAPTTWNGYASSLLVFAAAQDSALTSTWTPPSGMTEQYDSGGASAQTVATLASPGLGFTGTKTATPSDATDQNTAFLIVLLPSGYDTTYPIIENVWQGQNTANSALTIPIKINENGTNRHLLCAVQSEDDPTTGGDNSSISSVTYNAGAMSADASIETTQAAEDIDISAIYSKSAPTTGSHNVVITMVGTVNSLAGVVLSIINAGQSGQPDATGSAKHDGVSGDITTTVSPVSTNTIIIDNAVSGLSTATIVPGASQTQIYNFSGGTGEFIAGVSIKQSPTAGANSMSWTNDDATRPWAITAVAIKAVSSVSTSIKTINGLAKASVKTVNGLAIASVKTKNGLT